MKLLRLCLRCCAGFALLLLLRQLPPLPVALPGANPINALILGLLGAPGFALLLLLPVILS